MIGTRNHCISAVPIENMHVASFSITRQKCAMSQALVATPILSVDRSKF